MIDNLSSKKHFPIFFFENRKIGTVIVIINSIKTIKKMILIENKVREYLTETEKRKNELAVHKILTGIKNGFVYSVETEFVYLIINGKINSVCNSKKNEKPIIVNWNYFLHGKYVIRSCTNNNLCENLPSK